jgi:hypothetical protein
MRERPGPEIGDIEAILYLNPARIAIAVEARQKLKGTTPNRLIYLWFLITVQ